MLTIFKNKKELKPLIPIKIQYNSKFNMRTGHYERRGLIDQKATHPIMKHSERPVSASDLGAVNKFKSRMAAVRLYQEV